jgi:ATP/maltotriose-dependent transcriptional regulator MalT
LLRQYTQEALAAEDEHEKASLDHARYYATFMQQREPVLKSRGQKIALDDIQADWDNICQACAKLIERSDPASVRLMLPGLYAFCDMRSRFHEGEAIFRQAVMGLAPGPGESPHPAWAIALLSWYDLYAYGKRHTPGEALISQAQSCLEQARSMHDSQMVAASLVLLGAIAEDQADFEQAVLAYEQALLADPGLDDIYWVNMRIGLCRQATGQYPEALEAFRTCLRRGEASGERVKTAWSLVNIGDTLLLQGNAAEARGYLQQSRAFFDEIATQVGLLWACYSLSRAELQLGDVEEARHQAELAAGIARQIHSDAWIEKTEKWIQFIDPEGAISNQAIPGREKVTLSQRELEVLQYLKSELSGPEIARRMYISLNTVHYHTKNIYQKLGVSTRLEAIRRTKELGL